MKRRVGKTKRQQHKKAAGRSTAFGKKGRRGIELTFNRDHRVPGNPGGRGAFPARRRARRK